MYLLWAGQSLHEAQPEFSTRPRSLDCQVSILHADSQCKSRRNQSTMSWLAGLTYAVHMARLVSSSARNVYNMIYFSELKSVMCTQRTVKNFSFVQGVQALLIAVHLLRNVNETITKNTLNKIRVHEITCKLCASVCRKTHLLQPRCFVHVRSSIPGGCVTCTF